MRLCLIREFEYMYPCPRIPACDSPGTLFTRADIVTGIIMARNSDICRIFIICGICLLVVVAYNNIDHVFQEESLPQLWSPSPSQSPDYKQPPASSAADQENTIGTQKTQAVKKTQVIIFTERRSGSTFSGELFNQNEDFMYFFEPLHSYELMKERRNESRLPGPIFNQPYSSKLFESILNCKFSHAPHGWQLLDLCFYGGSSDENNLKALAHFCGGQQKRARNADENDVQLLSSSCNAHRGVAIKTIRIQDIGALKNIVSDPKLNVKVLHLIRDPRGVMNSRIQAVKRQPWLAKRRNNGPSAILNLCKNMDINLQYWVDTPDWLKGRYKLVLYEDIAEQPISVARDIYNFIQMKMPRSVSDWLDKNTKEQPSSRGMKYITTRDSNKTASKWKKQLDRLVIEDIQQKCKKSMQMLGYENI